ncbi:DUF6924 domain-containing protein [Amycolatopsis samaneae]|uniref:DUF6924 domain-containing protein n=1 Tax=Amycolatopsis samaneae TaxID=664691 RepID=A0ABW5GL79_9PSEU
MLFPFRLWRRTWGSTVWLPESPLVLRVDDGEGALPVQLSWGTEDETRTSVGFAPDMASCYGHRQGVDGHVVELRGELAEHTSTGDEARGYEFHTEVGGTSADTWSPAGELRVLIDDGGEAPLRWLSWRDASGGGASVLLRSVGLSGGADVTDLVTAVWTSSEYRDAGEVAANLVQRGRDKWLALESAASLEFILTRPVAVTTYSFTSANDEPGRDPERWTLSGSADGNRWQVLDTRAGQSFTDRHQSRMYRIAGPVPYDRYRFEFAGNHGDYYLQLESVRLFASGSSGFAGYRQRAGEAPVAYRGTPAGGEAPEVPTSFRAMEPLQPMIPATPLVPAVPSSAAVPLSPLVPNAPAIPVGTPLLPPGDSVPLVRTDFSDDAAWAATARAVTAEYRADDIVNSANVVPVDDVRFEGLDAAQLVRLVPPGASWDILLLADGAAMTSAEHHVLVVSLDEDSHGESFRATPPAVVEIETNLSIANMDWEDFADGLAENDVAEPILDLEPVSWGDGVLGR